MELEEPFMDERNDIALADLHVDFSEKLLTLINRLTWRSSWPEGASSSTPTGERDTTHLPAASPRHTLTRFEAEEQASARHTANATADVLGEANDPYGAAGNRTHGSVDTVASVQP